MNTVYILGRYKVVARFDKLGHSWLVYFH